MTQQEEAAGAEDCRITVRQIGNQARVTLPEWVRTAAKFDAKVNWNGHREGDVPKWKVKWIGDADTQHILLSNTEPDTDRFFEITTSSISDSGTVRIPTAVQDSFEEIVGDGAMQVEGPKEEEGEDDENAAQERLALGFVARQPMLTGKCRAVFCLHARDLSRYLVGPDCLNLDNGFGYFHR